MKWSCCSECKAVTEAEVDVIVNLKQAFKEPMKELRTALDACDYTRVANRDPASKVTRLNKLCMLVGTFHISSDSRLHLFRTMYW